MKWIIGFVVLIPALALAAGAGQPVPHGKEKPPAFGLSNNVVGNGQSIDPEDVGGQTRRLLDRQAHSRPASHSEISAPVYVETQQRLSRSFKKDIKDFSKSQTTQGSQGNAR